MASLARTCFVSPRFVPYAKEKPRTYKTGLHVVCRRRKWWGGDACTMSFEEESGRGTLTHGCGCAGASREISRQIVRLQALTLIWMVVNRDLELRSAAPRCTLGGEAAVRKGNSG